MIDRVRAGCAGTDKPYRNRAGFHAAIFMALLFRDGHR